MIVSSDTPPNKTALFAFLRMNGVLIHASEDFQAIGRIGAGGRLIGVVGFNGFTPQFAQIHSAGIGNWVSRGFIAQVFTYAFTQLGLRYLIAPVGAKNHRALKFDKHIGFTYWTRLPDGYDDDEDLILLKMSKEECRWLSSIQRKAA